MSGDLIYGAPLRITEVKATGDAWEVSGYASTFNNVDLGGDVVLRGAFSDSLKAGEPIRFLYSHNPAQVLGKPLALKEDEKGLRGTFRISKTALGQDVHTLLKDGALDSFSIGYIPRDFEYDDAGVRKLKAVDLLEVSVVAMPMNPAATVTAVKTDALLADDAATKATWTAAYVNNLPDSAFAVILDGGEKDGEGKTTPRSLRKLPHHNDTGAVDLPHLRNALSREPQTDMPAAAHEKARAHLLRHARAEGIGNTDALPVETLLDFASLVSDDTLQSLNGLWERRRDEGQRPSDRLIALVDAYRQKRLEEADALLALLTAAPPDTKSAATDDPEGSDQGAESTSLDPSLSGLDGPNGEVRPSRVDAYLRHARIRALRAKHGLPPLVALSALRDASRAADDASAADEAASQTEVSA